jgi:hypothetical protein
MILSSYERVSREIRIAKDIQRQNPDIPWTEALRIAAKWIDKDSLTDAPSLTIRYTSRGDK